ncbi:MAG: ATP-binding cassette domain-containing protein, partial [Thermodesulfobacteriota bacterium]
GLIRPEGGCITINGQNLAELNKRAWLEHIAYVPQRPHLFARSVRDNIGLGNEQASQPQIERAAARARIKEEIQALPQGWDTLLGEDGLNLSGGQRQRVALARAFVRDCPLILVDEPGSGLDTSTRGLIYEALRDLAQTRLVIASTHDPDLLPFAVQVV